MDIEQIKKKISLEVNDDWSGCAICHTFLQSHKHYRNGKYFPYTEDYRFLTRTTTLQKVPIYVDFLLVANIFLLTLDLDEGTPLDNFYPLILETYKYGTWNQGLPEYQNKEAQFFVGDFNGSTGITTLSLGGEKRYIPRYKPDEELEKIAKNRRIKAADYLKARAKILDIGEQVTNFFGAFTLEELRYIESGDNTIITILSTAPDAWLNTLVPTIDPPNNTVRDQIILYLSQPLTVPSPATIDQAVIDIYTPASQE